MFAGRRRRWSASSSQAGRQVESTADHQIGVVTALTVSAGLVVYQVTLAGGASKSILETGLRPAIITDPDRAPASRRSRQSPAPSISG